MDYSKKTRNELIDICKERGIKGYSTKKKEELVTLLDTTMEVETNKTPIIKPIIKWVGGKTQIIEDVMELFPTQIQGDYYEPFLGGGSVLLAFLSYIKDGKNSVSGRIYASDLNSNLVGLYKNIQTNPDGLISELRYITNEYNTCTGTEVNRKPETIKEAMLSHESYYYWIRSQFNRLSKGERMGVLGSAMLVFMNKTCFRGVYREGPNGFNVPFGNYKNPGIFDEDHIREVSALIKDVVFEEAPFEGVLEKVKGGDFIYLDPPYAPETATSFVGYTADGFTIEDHTKLFKMCNAICGRGGKLLMSNADVSLVKNAFPEPTYETKIIECRRTINSKNPEAKTNEVLIRN
jgi:DNA adenine methylase